jgi:hypothetical protein
MKKITTPAGVFGPYNSIEILADRYHVDGADLPFTVVGQGVIEDAQEGDFPPPPPAPAPVPESVSPRQIRQALTQVGLRSVIEESINGGDQNAKDWYEYATSFERKHPIVLGMAQALGITEQQLDDLWRLAASL